MMRLVVGLSATSNRLGNLKTISKVVDLFHAILVALFSRFTVVLFQGAKPAFVDLSRKREPYIAIPDPKCETPDPDKPFYSRIIRSEALLSS